MKRSTYTKPNSHTQQQCDASISTVTGIMERIHISYEDWLLLLFETGYQLVQQQACDELERVALLQDVQHGFWAWWMFGFIQHDAVLLQRPIIGSYRAEKKKMLEYMRLEFLTENQYNL